MGLFELFQNFFHLNAREPAKEMAVVYTDASSFKLEGHVFPASKYVMLHDMLCFDEDSGSLKFFEPHKISRNDLELVHTKEFLDDLFTLRHTERTKYSELPLMHSILDSFLYAVGGTVLATELTKTYPAVFHIGGGFHHSFADHAEGFCYLNDVAVAVKKYQEEFPGKKVLLIDLDVHQGNGNASIFKYSESVYTFSMHQDDIYPMKEISNLDIGLQAGCEDEEYLTTLTESLAKIQRDFKADLIYYLAGADPFKEDRLGGLKITFDGLEKRDRIVKQFAFENKIPIVIVTAGGYAKNFQDTVKIHFNTARVFLRD